MRLKKEVSMLFLSALVFLAAVDAQTVKPLHQVKILNNYGLIPFDDGKTIISEVKFLGVDSDYEHYDETVGIPIPESDCRKILREKLAEIKVDDKFSGGRVSKAVKLLREWLFSEGYVDAEITAFGEKLPKNRMNLVFKINRGVPAYVSQIRFAGNFNISNDEYVADFKECSGDSWKLFNTKIYDYYSNQCSRRLMFSKGYVKGRIVKIASKIVGSSRVVTIAVDEGIRYRIGEIKIEGAKAYTDKEILEMLGLNEGDVANAKHFQEFVYEDLKRKYADEGYIYYNAEFDPEIIESHGEGLDGTVNILITIDEGLQYKISKITFVGFDAEKNEKILQKLEEILGVKAGEIYNQTNLEKGVKKINETEEFYQIDFLKDVEILTPTEIDELTTEQTNKAEIRIRLRKIE